MQEFFLNTRGLSWIVHHPLEQILNQFKKDFSDYPLYISAATQYVP
jgi:hypothetical protein